MKKGNSKNEILLLIAILVAAVLCVYYVYVLSPMISSQKELKTQLDNEDLLVRNMYAVAVGRDNALDTLLESAAEAEQEMSPLFVKAENEDYMVFFREMLVASGIKLVSISSDNEYDFEYDAMPVESETLRIKESIVTIEAIGTYDQVHAFLSLVSAGDKLTVCKRLEISKPANELTLVVAPVEYGEIPEIAKTPEYSDQFLKSDKLNLEMDFRMINIVSSAATDLKDYQRTGNSDQIVPQEFLDGSYREAKGLWKIKR